MVFRSKIAPWFHVLAVLFTAATVLFVCLALWQGQPVLYLAAGIFVLLLGLVILPMWLRTRYVLEETGLRIVSGLSRKTIAYGDILEAAPNADYASAPALSLDRVQLRYRTREGDRNYVSLSPRDKEAFLRELRQRVAVQN